jgi:tripartite-type tricarboxylate transporter receptor subunit TctC
VQLDSWYGIFGPKGMPADAVKVLNEHLNVILKMPDVIERIAIQGTSPVGGSPEVLARTNRADVELVGNIIKDLNIKSD